MVSGWQRLQQSAPVCWARPFMSVVSGDAVPCGHETWGGVVRCCRQLSPFVHLHSTQECLPSCTLCRCPLHMLASSFACAPAVLARFQTQLTIASRCPACCVLLPAVPCFAVCFPANRVWCAIVIASLG